MELIFNKEFKKTVLSKDLKNKTAFIKSMYLKGNKLVISFKNSVAQSEIDIISDIIINHNKNKINTYLLIDDYLDKNDNILTTDVSVLGLRKKSPMYMRGRKTMACYHGEDGTPIVEKRFKDLRDENGVLSELEITFNWFNNDGTIGLTKIDIAKEYNIYEAEREEEKRRCRQFAYLRASAKNTPNEPFITLITRHYQNEIDLYKSEGDLLLKDSMNNETDPTISAILNTEVDRNDDPTKKITVKNSILYQMGEYVLM